MDFFSAMRISASGLTAQRTRMNVTASNLANVDTTAPNGELGYKRRSPVMSAVPLSQAFGEVLGDQIHEQTHTVEVSEIAELDVERLEYQPDHPHADEQGYVHKPDISVIQEMVNMVTSSRGYEANVTAIQTIKNMANQALTIGER
ncbi:MAG: flagellar basal body rod protein FlgC [Bradymonadia bacterium]